MRVSTPSSSIVVEFRRLSSVGRRRTNERTNELTNDRARPSQSNPTPRALRCHVTSRHVTSRLARHRSRSDARCVHEWRGRERARAGSRFLTMADTGRQCATDGSACARARGLYWIESQPPCGVSSARACASRVRVGTTTSTSASP